MKQTIAIAITRKSSLYHVTPTGKYSVLHFITHCVRVALTNTPVDKRTSVSKKVDEGAPSVVSQLVEHRTCISKVVGSDPTDEKGVSPSTLISVNICFNDYTTVKRRNHLHYAFLRLIVCSFRWWCEQRNEPFKQFPFFRTLHLHVTATCQQVIAYCTLHMHYNQKCYKCEVNFK